MKVKVMKFGGTSVATPEARMQAALRVISAREQGFSPVVVVSAIGRRGQPYATDTLLELLREIDPTVKPDAREADLMIACGEIFSSVIFAHTLKSLGHPAKAYRGGQAGIRTDGTYGNARVISINPVALRRCLEEQMIPVVCGFQGVFYPDINFPGGELTTLGRGGSDTTAAALGAALKADAVEIFTDVDGVKTADPDYVPHAPTLRKVSYEEVAEIAHLGAKVLHPRAAEIAMKFDIPLWVKSTFTNAIGTEIVGVPEGQERPMTGVTHTGKLVYLEFDLGSVPPTHRTSLESRVCDMLAKYSLNLYMITLGANGIGFAVSRDQYPTVKDLLDGLVVPLGDEGRGVYMLQIGDLPSREAETQAKLLEPLGPLVTIPIELTEGCTMVSIIGREHMRRKGAYRRALSTLHEQQVPILQTSDSELSISCLIPESELSRAVDALHASFDLTQVS
jgi:aspartate kinase